MALAKPTEMIEQLDELLDEYKNLCNQSQHDDLSDLPEESRVLANRLQAAIDRLTIPDSSYAKAAEQLRKSANHVKVVELSGVAAALSEDLKKGWAQSITELVHANTFADLLEMASELQTKHYKDAAAVIAGTALEVHLRALCVKQGLPVALNGKPKKADLLNAELTKSSAYTALQQKQVTSWLGIRNAAAHGNYSEYDEGDVKRLIESVGEFMDRHPA